MLQGQLRFELIGFKPSPYMFIVNYTTGMVTLARNITGSYLETLDAYVVSTHICCICNL